MASTFNPQNILILRYRSRKIAVPRDQCHYLEDLISLALLAFGSLQGIQVEDVVVVAKIPGHTDTEPVENFPTLWPTMSRIVDNVTIMLVSERDASSSTTCKSSDSVASPEKARPSTLPPAPNHPTLPSHSHPPFSPEACQDSLALPQTLPMPVCLSRSQKLGGTTFDPQVINITFISQGFFHSAPPPFSINEEGLLGKKVSYLYERIQTRVISNLVISGLRYGSLFLDKQRTLSSYAMHSGSTVTATLSSQRPQICKSVVYLYPPSSLADVSVELTLVPSWSFLAVHPPQQKPIFLGERRKAQCWKVAAEPNGTLLDKTTGIEISYLHWEATADSRCLTTYTPPNPMENTEEFDPLYPSVDPNDSVLLPKSKLPGYLDLALKALSLNPEARNAFITFWLPFMQKHEHIALRFVAQESYQKAAAMRITPAPDIVTRVFMLFHGVAAGDLSRWESARALAETEGGATFWPYLMGGDAARAADRGLFRVLEWGGMEVY